MFRNLSNRRKYNQSILTDQRLSFNSHSVIIQPGLQGNSQNSWSQVMLHNGPEQIQCSINQNLFQPIKNSPLYQVKRPPTISLPQKSKVPIQKIAKIRTNQIKNHPRPIWTLLRFFIRRINTNQRTLQCLSHELLGP